GVFGCADASPATPFGSNTVTCPGVSPAPIELENENPGDSLIAMNRDTFESVAAFPPWHSSARRTVSALTRTTMHTRNCAPLYEGRTERLSVRFALSFDGGASL